MAGCEDDYFEVFGEGSEDFNGIGADVDSGFDLLSGWEFNLDFDVVWQVEGVVAVNESLIQIEYNRLFI